jgi:hypothetical protein
MSPPQTPCAAGKWSNTPRLGVPCVSDCDAGYVCNNGSTSPQQLPCGDERFYCPTGTPAALPVGAGYHTIGGTPATRVGRELCPGPDSNGGVSAYCSGDGRVSTCPGGVFGNASGLSTAACSGVCRAGYYCPQGSTNATAFPCGGVAFYCPPASPARVAVQQGFYSLPEDAAFQTTRTGEALCQPGEYCIAGMRYQCAPGRYSTDSGRATACTEPCPPGNAAMQC